MKRVFYKHSDQARYSALAGWCLRLCHTPSRRCLFLATFLSTLAVLAHDKSNALAQDAVTKSNAVVTAALPADLPPIPGPTETDTPLYVTRSNVSLFHEVLLAPIASWLKEGLLMTRVVRALNFNWELDPDWESSSVSNVGRFDVDATGGLVLANPHPLAGYPFGRAEQINQESDPQRRAYMVLWNATFAEAPSVDLLQEIELRWMNVKGVSRRADGLFYRRMKSGVLPSSGSTSEGSASEGSSCEGQECETTSSQAVSGLFREEVLQLRSPPVVLGFTMVDHRYLGEKDDDFWIHSPVTGRSRHVFSSNRSDPILGGVLTFDDFFVWSGKIQAFIARVVEEKTLLVPFPSLRAVEISRARTGTTTVATTSPAAAPTPGLPPAARSGWGGMFSVPELFTRRDSSATNMLWNVDTGKFPQAASWVPSTMVLVPRRVWIIELSPRDPFYLSGRQILVVDQQSMLPVYKVVYDRSGNYKKTVIGGWGLATTADGKIRFPFPGFVLGVKADGQIAMSATSSAVETFLGKDIGRARELAGLLDIKSFEAKNGTQSSAEAGKTESSTQPPAQAAVSSKAASASATARSATPDAEQTDVDEDVAPAMEVDEAMPED